jgi:hypothetical protein
MQFTPTQVHVARKSYMVMDHQTEWALQQIKRENYLQEKLRSFDKYNVLIQCFGKFITDNIYIVIMCLMNT